MTSRKLAALLLIICLSSLIGLGALAMSAGNMHGGVYKGCLASAAQNTPCPADDSFNFSLFHLDALKKFSTAYLPSLLAVLILIAIAIGTMVSFGNKFPLPQIAAPLLINDFWAIGSAYKTKNEFSSWFSLLEKSPAVF